MNINFDTSCMLHVRDVVIMAWEGGQMWGAGHEKCPPPHNECHPPCITCATPYHTIWCKGCVHSPCFQL